MNSRKYNITVFEAVAGGKVPRSPFGDKTFVFRTREISTNFEFLSILGKHFILNQPLKDAGPDFDFRDLRRISTLRDKFQDNFDYIILDVDDVVTRKDMDKILQYFKEYKVVLGESYSHNGIDNFRLKGVLFCEPGDIKDVQNSLRKISEDLRVYCQIDTSRGFIPSFNAPGRKNKPILNNENGVLWKHRQRLELAPVQSTELEVKTTNPLDFKIQKYSPKDFKEAESVQDICLMYFENMGFESISPGDGFIKFKHGTEVKSPGGFSWSPDNPYFMRHWNPDRCVDAFSVINKMPRVRELISSALNYDSELLSYNPKTTLLKVNERYLEMTPEITDAVENFVTKDKGVFSIRSGMGTGKSTIIKHIIDTAHDYGMRCLIITNRISVAEDFKEKYGVSIYNSTTDKYERGESLICQFDSLWKYDLQDFDVVVMDEFISLMIHSRSELGNSSFNLIKFFAAFGKKLVIADAFLTGYERFLLPKSVDDNAFLLDNEYRDNTVLYDYEDKNNFVLQLLSTAREHKVTISSTSIRFLEDTRSLLQDNGLRTMTLTADTPEHTKELIYETFKTDHDKYDVLLYSPTLTVGVSNLNTVNYHFHYDSSQSADVISSLQMVKRTRKAREIHLFVRPAFKHLETDYNRLRKQYLDNVGKAGDFSVLFEVNDYGDVQISEIGKKALKIDVFKNVLSTNHRSAFLWLLRYHFKHEPRVISTKFSGNILMKYTRENTNNAKQQQEELIKEFLNLSEVQKVEVQGNSFVRRMADIHENLNIRKILNSGKNEELKTRLMNAAIKDREFIDNCRYYNLFQGYMTGTLSDNDIKYRMQKYISNSDMDRVRFCSRLSQIRTEFSTEYEMRELQNKDMNFILPRCGYIKTSSVGRRFMRVQKDIQELSEYVNEF